MDNLVFKNNSGGWRGISAVVNLGFSEEVMKGFFRFTKNSQFMVGEKKFAFGEREGKVFISTSIHMENGVSYFSLEELFDEARSEFYKMVDDYNDKYHLTQSVYEEKIKLLEERISQLESAVVVLEQTPKPRGKRGQ